MASLRIIEKVRIAVAVGHLKQPFCVRDVYTACGGPYGTWASFLAKHCIGNPTGEPEHFVRIARGLYRLKPPKRDA